MKMYKISTKELAYVSAEIFLGSCRSHVKKLLLKERDVFILKINIYDKFVSNIRNMILFN